MFNCKNPNSHCRCAKMAQIISGILFGLIAITQLICVMMGTVVIVDGAEVPAWQPWLVIIVSAVMSAWNFCACCCKKCNVVCTDKRNENLPPPPPPPQQM